MIEIVYTAKDNGRNNDVIRLPKNIKQIGDIKDSRKIYIEDYAINYIEEVHTEIGDTVVGVLLGMAQKSGSDRYVFIKGAITVPNVFVSESEISMSENDWSYVYEIAGKYFPSQEIVGWFISIDGVNASVLRTMKKAHADYFAGGEKVLFVFDRQENAKYFCTYENNQLVRQGGYTIYYERNEEMQDYMVDMRNGKRIEIEVEQEEVRPAFRNMVSEEKEPQRSGSRKQAFVNYCANVAMVVLILFVGMYVMDERNGNKEVNVTEGNTSTITQVVKVDGNVYPTETQTDVQSVADMQMETTSESNMFMESSAQQLEETTTGSYLTINTNDNRIQTQTQTQGQVEETQKETEAATQANVTSYEVHVVEKGESLLTISRKYYGDNSMIEEIMELNDIDDMDKIYIGQKIKLP